MKQRIAYIDAMRGFTMILVVYSHICGFCLGDTRMGFNDVLFLFRLPCFFMISGWLFQPVSTRPFWQVVHRKFMVQIVPTFIFLLLLAPPPLFFRQLGATKGGYWFTFALFEFFVIYMLSVRLKGKWGVLVAVVLSFSAFCYDIYYNRLVLAFPSSAFITQPLGFLSFMTWRYYLFFFVGTWVRRHFDSFLRWTQQPLLQLLAVAGFVAVAVIPHSDRVLMEFFIFAVGGILGMTMVFTFFRWLYTSPRLSPWASRLTTLEFVGTRTLDIYLLHYFFLPRFLVSYGEQLRSYHCLPLEMAAALLPALVVVALCLLVSYVIRLSPFLGRLLFGAKQ